MVSPHLNTQFLFCEEEHFENSNSNSYTSLHQQQQEEEETDSCSSYHHSLNAATFLNPFEQDEELRTLLYKEEEKEPHRGFKDSPSLAKSRREVVEWMLRVIGYYSFSSLTAVLAVSYLDRFLHRFQPLNDDNKPWMFQLSAVACLSLAAKVDETDVPLLLDLQVEEPRFVFEPRVVQRMEVLVLSTLEWKMNSVTAVSFLDYIARRLSLEAPFCLDFLSRCERLILSVITDSRFMAFLPSTMATATMVHVVTSIDPSIALENHDSLLGILGINKDKVRDCYDLIQEVAANDSNKRKMGSWPCSPKGMFDLSFISDSSNDSWAFASNPSSPEPQFKKIKIQKNFQFSEF